MNAIAMRKQEEDWRCERDLETLMEAEKIQRDPKRMAKVAAMAKDRMMNLASVAAEASEGSGKKS